MNNQKDITDNRLAEINTELTSLKTLVSQRMNANSNTSASSGYFRGANGASGVNGANGTSGTASPTTAATQSATSPHNESTTETSSTPKPEAPKSVSQNKFSRTSGISAGSGAKASIPAWQMAMANQGAAGSAGSSSPGKEAEKTTTDAATGSS
jgi:peroxin-14